MTCPDCSTRYTVDAKTLGQSGRKVRCASCAHEWFAKPEDDAANAPAPAEDLPMDEMVDAEEAAIDEMSAADVEDVAMEAETPPAPHRAYRDKLEKRAKRKSFMVSASAWAGIAAVLLVIALLAIFNRDAVVRTLPKTASVFDAIGLPADRWAVELKPLRSEIKQEGADVVMHISAEIVNASKKSRWVPLVRLSLRDETGEELYAWTESTGLESLAPQTSAVFNTSVRNPAPEAVDIHFDFTDKPIEGQGASDHARKEEAGH